MTEEEENKLPDAENSCRNITGRKVVVRKAAVMAGDYKSVLQPSSMLYDS